VPTQFKHALGVEVGAAVSGIGGSGEEMAGAGDGGVGQHPRVVAGHTAGERDLVVRPDEEVANLGHQVDRIREAP
jgi:hypothetical protein